MMLGHDTIRLALIVGALMLPATSAMADAIDGDWCAPGDGKYVRILGSTITTSSGSQTTGIYTRHAFAYVVPEGDPAAGSAVAMQLLNDDETRVTAADGTSEVWHRCQLNV